MSYKYKWLSGHNILQLILKVKSIFSCMLNTRASSTSSRTRATNSLLFVVGCLFVCCSLFVVCCLLFVCLLFICLFVCCLFVCCTNTPPTQHSITTRSFKSGFGINPWCRCCCWCRFRFRFWLWVWFWFQFSLII